MQTTDFPEFKQLLLRFTMIWPKRELTDEKTAPGVFEIYWRAVKDLPLAAFRKFCERHEKHGRRFPQPSDLRPKEDKLPDVSGSREGSGDADARCVRNLERLKRLDPDAWKREVAIRRMGRIIAAQPSGSSMYEAAMTELRVLGADNGRWVAS